MPHHHQLRHFLRYLHLLNGRLALRWRAKPTNQLSYPYGRRGLPQNNLNLVLTRASLEHLGKNHYQALTERHRVCTDTVTTGAPGSGPETLLYGYRRSEAAVISMGCSYTMGVRPIILQFIYWACIPNVIKRLIYQAGRKCCRAVFSVFKVPVNFNKIFK